LTTNLPFFDDMYFEPDATAAMGGAAFEKACGFLDGTSQADIIREIIAKGIIDLARNGERDPDQLCDEALKTLGFG
jgi:hypothetical protein